jgi:hypothetical protein
MIRESVVARPAAERRSVMSLNPFRLIPLLVIACLGCARTSPLPPPSQAELRERERLKANETEAKNLIAAGSIHAGQDLWEFLKVCKPYRVDFVDRYAFIEFYPVPNLDGLSFIAIDGKLVSARRWGCNWNEALFETISADERRIAMDAYGPRVYGYREWER